MSVLIYLLGSRCVEKNVLKYLCNTMYLLMEFTGVQILYQVMCNPGSYNLPMGHNNGFYLSLPGMRELRVILQCSTDYYTVMNL